ncbi:hypothetical protein Lal_00043057 [Lupinus albus]|nr:hypothetical protein Lal_00043057 [Lupinus albus]
MCNKCCRLYYGSTCPKKGNGCFHCKEFGHIKRFCPKLDRRLNVIHAKEASDHGRKVTLSGAGTSGVDDPARGKLHGGRRNTSILHSINPEIDRIYHRLVGQNRTLDTNFVFVSEHPVAENTTSKHFVSVHSEYSDSVHSVAFPNFDHSVHSENMAQPPTPPGPRERILRELVAPDFTYDSSCIQYEDVPYVLKTGLLHLLPKFNGLAGQDPHKHLKEFHIVCSTMKPHDVMEDYICLQAFPHSPNGPAKDWLYYFAPGSITSWGDLKRSFLGKFFPTSRTTTIRKDISGIRQQHGESLYD